MPIVPLSWNKNPIGTRSFSNSVAQIPLDKSSATNLFKEETRLGFTLTQELTEKLLTEIAKQTDFEINDILLAALSKAFFETFGHQEQVIALEKHGRETFMENLDITRTMGWFTSVFPFSLSYNPNNSKLDNIADTQTKLAAIPLGGIGYGILKYLTAASHKSDLKFELEPQVIFNYLGQVTPSSPQDPFYFAAESPGNAVGGMNQRMYDLEVDGIVIQNQLQIGITFNPNHFFQETIEKLLNQYQNAIEQLTEACLESKLAYQDTENYTTKGISQTNLQKLKELFE